jgi:hypothetical protein
LTGDKVISADKMMNKARGPLWHKKHKQQGIIPKGLRGIDRQATWCKSNADGWVYGHGSFTITPHKHPVLGCFMWMPNSANEAKRLWRETFHVKEHIDYVAMDSKADDFDLFRELKRQRKMNLITYCRQNMNLPQISRHTEEQIMIKRNRRCVYAKKARFRIQVRSGSNGRRAWGYQS